MQKLKSITFVFLCGLAAVGLASTTARAGLMWEFGFVQEQNNFAGYGIIGFADPGSNQRSYMGWSGVCGYTANVPHQDVNDCFPNNSDLDNDVYAYRPTQYDINFRNLKFNDLFIFGEEFYPPSSGSYDYLYYTITITEDELTLTCESYFFEDNPQPMNCNGRPSDFRTATFVSGEAYIRFMGDLSGYEIREPNPLGIFLTGLAALWALSFWSNTPPNVGFSGQRHEIKLTKFHGFFEAGIDNVRGARRTQDGNP